MKVLLKVCQENNLNLQVAEVFLQNDFCSHFEFGRSLSHAYNSVPRQMCARCSSILTAHVLRQAKTYFSDLLPITGRQNSFETYSIFSQRMNQDFIVFSTESKCGIKSITRKVWAFMLASYLFRVSCYPVAKHL